ncbi:DALR anticodon-binding domain-containing protein [Nocardia asteroides]|uniref:DALR anticodon-binding domain-containing protein n=1 Tax=Nocardia asteroides TaxID=1824 RepID=UPI0037AC0C15
MPIQDAVAVLTRSPEGAGKGLPRLVRSNRIALCQWTARTLELGLEQLGIAAPQRM